MNAAKTKVQMSNSNNIADIDRGNHSKITEVDEYVCSGKEYPLIRRVRERKYLEEDCI